MAHRIRTIVIAVVALAVYSLSAPLAQGETVAASSGRPNVAPPGSQPYGLAYGEWAVRWWEWALKTPVQANGSHPLLDQGAVDCSAGQSARVWFLAGSITTEQTRRRCAVPKDKALFLPLINTAYFAFLSDPPETRTASFCRSQIADREDIPDYALSARIDGNTVHRPDRFFKRSPIFDVELPAPDPDTGEQNLLSFIGYTEDDIPDWVLDPSCDAGFYLFLRPLSVGAHTIQLTASNPVTGASQETTYRLRVGGAG